MKQNKKIIVKIDDVEYKLDVEKAIEDGNLVEEIPEITSFKIGDIFKGKVNRPIVIVNLSDPFEFLLTKSKFALLGADQMQPYVTMGRTYDYNSVLTYINHYKLRHVGNINFQFQKMMQKFE